MRSLVFLFLLSAISWSGRSQQVQKFRNGRWRGVLERQDGNQIVFNFDVKDSGGRKIVYIRNAAERLLVDDISMQGDSLVIILPFFESQLHAVFTNTEELRGVWLKRGADRYQVTPFAAFYNQAYRFATSDRKPVADITGRWAVTFTDAEHKNEEASVGEFTQQGNHISGTFLTTTGDDRYLEGVVDGDSVKLSCFDGGHAFLFTAKIESDHVLSAGMYYSGLLSKQFWAAKKDANASLPDEFAITRLKPGQSTLDFTFKDIDGRNVSLSDARFRNKVVLIQLMGSWCPNCMDETAFLSPFYDKYKSKGVEIIGLAYERTTDFERSQKSLRSFQTRFNVKYPLLITGVTVGDTLRDEKTLPQLQSIQGFPTTIFIGKNGKVEKIHTGFNGPGTGEHYEAEKKVFYQIVDGLLAQ